MVWLQLRGRERDEINKGGMKIYPADVDAVVERFAQTTVYLEEQYGIDFAASGFDPDRLATMGSIVDLIEQARA